MYTPIGGTVHVSSPFCGASVAEDLPRRVMRIRKIAAIILELEMFVSLILLLKRGVFGGRVKFVLLERMEIRGRLDVLKKEHAMLPCLSLHGRGLASLVAR
jgi:hypothetical protein